MKVVFLSNYFNHHQAPFCNAMYGRMGDSFVFVQTREMDAARVHMGWGLEEEPSYLKKSYLSASDLAKCQSLVDEADAVIIGSAPEQFICNRIKSGKLVLRYQERLFKRKEPFWKLPYIGFRLHKKNPRGSNVFLLCASAYTSSDYAKVGLFKNRCYKWGYFPEVIRYSDSNGMIASKKAGTILWVARMIDLKHPELPLLVAKSLKDAGYTFEMNLIGIGPLEDNLRRMIQSLGIADRVKLLGAMKPREVRKYMEESQIFLFTSDRNEGWGAVLNESMNSGCAVVVSNVVGAAPYLIRNGDNGFLYQDGDFDELLSKVKYLLDNPYHAAHLGKMAYETMISEWNSEAAAERLLLLLDDLQKSKDSCRYSQGPCSKADG